MDAKADLDLKYLAGPTILGVTALIVAITIISVIKLIVYLKGENKIPLWQISFSSAGLICSSAMVYSIYLHTVPINADTDHSAILLRRTLCKGEFEGNCLPHDFYIGCDSNPEDYAAKKCSPGKLKDFARTHTYSGNHCGYSLLTFACEN